MCKKLKTVDFINMWLFILEIEIFNFCICLIIFWTGKFMVDKIQILCIYGINPKVLIILTFSGLHFLYYMTPWIFNRGLPNPQWNRNRQNASLHCAVGREISFIIAVNKFTIFSSLSTSEVSEAWFVKDL